VRIAFGTSELSPHVHVGGLGDVSRWLPARLAAAGDEVAVFVPHYDVLDPQGEQVLPVPGLDAVPVGPFGEVSVSTLGEPGAGRPTVYLVGSPIWFERGAVYDAAPDGHLRFGALTAAIPAVCERLEWVPDVWHANDWHTALVAFHAAAAGEPWDAVPSVLTLHNLAFQGVFPAGDLGRMGLSGVADRLDPADLLDGWVNSLRNGIAAAAMVTTVSPTYAREITTPAQGMALDAALRAKGDRLVGILNGIGDDWDPASDPHIPERYGPGTVDRKAASTAALRGALGLLDRPGVPVAGIVSRLTGQKGFDLLRATLPPLLATGRLQLAVIGTGDAAYEALFADFARQFPGEAAYVADFSPPIAHLIEAGSDLFLMPSQFEPSGLNQMYSMRYGTVPIVRRTGGLADSVAPWDPAAGTGTGFVFDEFADAALAAALTEALAVYADPVAWRRLQLNGMTEDFSWDRRAREYRDVYRRAVGARS
jgi:starch synthase